MLPIALRHELKCSLKCVLLAPQQLVSECSFIFKQFVLARLSDQPSSSRDCVKKMLTCRTQNSSSSSELSCECYFTFNIFPMPEANFCNTRIIFEVTTLYTERNVHIFSYTYISYFLITQFCMDIPSLYILGTIHIFLPVLS